MSVADEIHFDKAGKPVRFPWLERYYIPIILVLVAILAFGLGRLSAGGERGPIKVDYDPSLTSGLPTSAKAAPGEQTATKQPTATAVQAVANTTVVGSSKGTKYHYLHCPGAKQISEKNKITFASPAAAEASGYTRAANCQPR